MTLADLLALLPDNTTGDISAADMRTIVTELHGLIGTIQLDQTVINQSILNDITALGGDVADHETRIGALENP